VLNELGHNNTLNSTSSLLKELFCYKFCSNDATLIVVAWLPCGDIDL